MGVELRPLGVHCNIACQYCYQNPQREAGNVTGRYDIAAMKAAIEREGGPFTLFGGEPLLVPHDDLETLFAWGLRRFGANQVQTNGTILDDRHVDLFRKYRVRVGISVDGPDHLNDVRWVGNLQRTREATARTHANIERLCSLGLAPSIIVTLHRVNAAAAALPAMNDWILRLEQLGVRKVRLHVLEVDDPAVGAKYQLSDDEQIAAFLNFKALEARRLTTLAFDIFQEARSLLLADDALAGCVWHACDPYSTKAVRGVEGDGAASNCGRTNKDGIDYQKSDEEGFERYIALYHTPMEHGGCQGCRFFAVCKGQCPGTAQNGDWRYRSASCALWTEIFASTEADLMVEGLSPVSLRPERPAIEAALLAHWAQGANPTLGHVVGQVAEETAP